MGWTIGYTPEGLACAPMSTVSSTLLALDSETGMPEAVHAPTSLLRTPVPICLAGDRRVSSASTGAFSIGCWAVALLCTGGDLGGTAPVDEADIGVDSPPRPAAAASAATADEHCPTSSTPSARFSVTTAAARPSAGSEHVGAGTSRWCCASKARGMASLRTMPVAGAVGVVGCCWCSGDSAFFAVPLSIATTL